MEEKSRVIWITQFPLSGVSFGIVSYILLSSLSDKYNFYCLSFGYEGQPLKVNNFTILPFRSSTEIPFYWKEINPELVVLFHSFFALPKMFGTGRFKEPSILYLPIEGYRLPQSYHSYLQNFERILVPSKWSKDALARDYFESEVIYHGVDTSFFKPIERKHSKITFGYLGSNDLRKQIPTLIEAFSMIKGKKQLNLACPIKGYVNFGDIARELKVVPKFQKALGRGIPVNPAKIRDFYYTLDVYVSLGTEGFGLPALESAATGIPTIAMNFGASKEILGKSALYVEPCTTQYSPLGKVGVVDAKEVAYLMQYLLEDRNERERLGKLGIKRAKQFSWENPIRKLDKILEEEIKYGKKRN